MATDPVRRVRGERYDLPVTFGVRDALTRLAAAEPSMEAPYLTVTLDWRPAGDDPGRDAAPTPPRSERRARRGEEGAPRRPARAEIRRQILELLEAAGPRGDAAESLSEDVERMAAFVDEELDPSVQGVYISACSATGVFEPLTFALPLPTALTVAPTPALGPLARFVDDHPAYAVLVADQGEAVLSDIRRATRGQSLQIESDLYPRKQKSGGLSQRRYQNRADERVAAFARVVADETQRRMDEFDVEQLIVAGAEVMTSALDAAFSPQLKEKIVAVIRLETTASDQEMLDATLPLVEEAERARETETVSAIADAVGAADRGAAGAAGVLSALQNGQVATLAMNDDFTAEGWADYGRETYGVGAVPDTHPLGGDVADLAAVDLFEEFTRLALRGGAEVEIIHSAVPVADDEGQTLPRAGEAAPRTEAAARLDELGGVGALLRFDVEPA
jgi:hypothetical protein